MIRRAMGCFAVAALLAPFAAVAQEGNPWTLRAIELANGVLKAQWMDVRIEQVEVLGRDQDKTRASSRLHPQPSRWVAGDPRRLADGDRLTYLVERADGPGGTGVLAPVEGAIDRAMTSWAAEPCLRKVRIVKRPDSGEDVDIFDSLVDYGGFGNWQAADIVVGGWMPPSFFDAVTGENGGTSVLALSVTFIFAGADGEPTDVDQDGFYDVAASEIYFNDGFSWQIGSSIDVETVALHELGHSLAVGHVDPRHNAAMNPAYAGVRRELRSKDRSAACPVWASWPNQDDDDDDDEEDDD